MKREIKFFLLSLTAVVLNACASPLPEKVIIGDIELSLFGGLIFLLLLGAALFFIFVWPSHKKRRSQGDNSQ